MRKCFIAGALLCMTAALGAQNLNPTVEVTNVYASSAKDIIKPMQDMAVPDSVTTFNLKLDYSVFDSPYKGAYEFSPYASVVPSAIVAKKRPVFFLKAGVGYSLHPELDAVYSPLLWDRLQLNVFARSHSYFGNYRGLEPDTKVRSGRDVVSFVPDGSRAWGYDSRTDAGIHASYPWEKVEATFRAAYTNISAKDYLVKHSVNGVRVGAGVHSLGTDKIRYGADIDWRFLHDGQAFNLTENRFDLRSHIAFPMSPLGEIYARVDGTFAFLNRDVKAASSLLWMTPGYIFSLGPVTFDLGVKVDVFMGDRERYRTQIVYPNVFVGFSWLGGDMTLYGTVKGGSHLNAYSDLVDAFHGFNLLHYTVAGSRLLDTSLERVNTAIGLRGQLARRFQFDLRGGYARVANGYLDGMVFEDPEGNPFAIPMPAVGYASYHLAYADLDLAWISDKLKVDGALSFKYTNLKDSPLFAPSLLSGHFGARYTWIEKVTAGVTVDFATPRTARFADDLYYRVPGYADLGVYAQYDITDWAGVWVKGGNLLNSTIQTVPLYGSGGIYFTVGGIIHF